MYYSHERDSVGHSHHVWDKPAGDTGQEPDSSERVRVVVGRPAVYPYPSVRVGVTRRCLQCILNAWHRKVKYTALDTTTRKPIGAGEGNSPAPDLRHFLDQVSTNDR